MEHFYQNMKSLFVLLLFVTSIVANHVDMEAQYSDKIEITIEYENCGPSSFSEGVKSSFLKKINSNYLDLELYKLTDWIVLINDNHCHHDLDFLFDLSNLEAYHSIRIIDGGWVVSFQSGDIAYSVLNNWKNLSVDLIKEGIEL